MSPRIKRVLLTLTELILCLTVAWWSLCALLHFRAAGHVSEMRPWLVSEADPTAVSAMNTLEEEQFKWRLGGGLCILYALPFLAGEIGLRRYRRKQRGEQNGNQTPDRR